MDAGDTHSILRRFVVGAQLLSIALVAAAAAYLRGHGSPDFFQQLVLGALVPMLVGLLGLGVGGLALYWLRQTVAILVAFDCIVVVGPLFYTLLGVASRDIRLFLFGLVVASVPIFGAVGAVIVDSDRPPRADPTPH